jgi:4'-phosphopantetheinyl transferase EntD
MTCATAHQARHALERRWHRDDGLGWLTSAEREIYAGFRAASRRQAWLHGRLLAKELILEALDASRGPREAARLEICSRDGLGRSVAPRILVEGRTQPWSLSIAHSETSVLVALSREADVSVGVDLVPPGALGAHGLDPWLTPGERQWLITLPAGERSAGASILWAIKEAAYKAVGRGAHFVPRRVEAYAAEGGSWHARFDDRVVTGVVHVTVTETDVAAVVTVAPR